MDLHKTLPTVPKNIQNQFQKMECNYTLNYFHTIIWWEHLNTLNESVKSEKKINSIKNNSNDCSFTFLKNSYLISHSMDIKKIKKTKNIVAIKKQPVSPAQ